MDNQQKDIRISDRIVCKVRAIYKERYNEHFLKDKDYLVSILFDRTFSIPIIRFMQYINLRIHPNVISFLSIPFILFAAYFFFKGDLVFGAFYYFCYFILDGVDGKWARLINKTSKFGERFEYYICVFGDIAMYFGLWYSQYYLKGDCLIGGSIIFAHYLIVAAIWIFLQQPYYETIFPNVCSYYSVEEEGFVTFFFAALFNVVHILFPILVALQFVSFTILFLRQNERPDIKKRIKEELLKI